MRIEANDCFWPKADAYVLSTFGLSKRTLEALDKRSSPKPLGRYTYLIISKNFSKDTRVGASQAAIAFRSQQVDFDHQRLSRLFNKRVEVLYQRPPRFDPRQQNEVVVEQYGDVWVISNGMLAMGPLENSHYDASELYRILGSPEMIISFCQYESGDKYGYAFIENGILTRSRLHPFDSPVQQFGPLKPFEDRWASAEFYFEENDCPEDGRQKIYYLGDREIEVPEFGLSSRLNYEALSEYLGICPWDNDLTPRIWYLRLHDLPQPRKPWWKLW